MKFSDVVMSDGILPRSEVDMSEFWGDGVMVYGRGVRPVDHVRISRDPKCKGWPEKFSMEGSVYLLTLIAEDENGEPFFDDPIKDRQKLMRMDQKIVAKLVQGLVESDPDDALKN